MKEFNNMAPVEYVEREGKVRRKMKEREGALRSKVRRG